MKKIKRLFYLFLLIHLLYHLQIGAGKKIIRLPRNKDHSLYCFIILQGFKNLVKACKSLFSPCVHNIANYIKGDNSYIAFHP